MRDKFKATIVTIICVGFFGLKPDNSFAQGSKPNTKKEIKIIDPYNHDVFIKNIGQLQFIPIHAKEPIYFYCKISDHFVYFKKNGLIIQKINTISYSSEDKGHEEEKKEKSVPQHQSKYIEIKFDTSISFQCPKGYGVADYYFTFSDSIVSNSSSELIANAFHKIVYESSVAHENIIISIDKKNQQLNFNTAENNKIIFTTNNKVIELQENTKNRVELKNNELTVRLSNVQLNKSIKYKNESQNDTLQTCKLITCTTGYAAALAFSNSISTPYDIDYDNNGNIYTYGGTYPYELMKFDSAGNLKWVHVTNIFGPYTYYGDFTINRSSESVYIVECWNFAAQAIKLNALGLQSAYFAGNNQLQEMYRVELNECTGNLIIAGGAQPTNTAILDTNLSSLTPINILSANNVGHDFCMLTSDEEGFVYLATTGLTGIPFDNIIVKAPSSSLLPVNFIVFDNYQFSESGSINYILNNNRRAGFNGLVAGAKYLFSYDGSLVQKWNKQSGVLTNSLILSNQSFLSGGIDVNNCGNLFVGKENKIVELDTGLTLLNVINVPDTIYDLRVSENGKIFACGKNYIYSISLEGENCSELNLQANINQCFGHADVSVDVLGGNPPYSFTWNPPVSYTNQSLNLNEGTYSVMVKDNSCSLNKKTNVITFTIDSYDELQIHSPDTVCEGSSIQLVSSISNNIVWSTGDSTASIILTPDSSIEVSLFFDNGNGCKDSTIKEIIVFPLPIINISGDDTICEGEIANLNGSGALIYLWNTGEVSESIDVKPSHSDNYFLAASNGFCTGVDSFHIYVLKSPKAEIWIENSDGISFTLKANGGVDYYWTSDQNIYCDTCNKITIYPEESKTYCVEVKNHEGCLDTACIKIHLPSIYVPDTFTPNNDGLNDIFIPITRDILDYSLMVFNKWGEKIFETGNSEFGWNGFYNGSICSDDVYVYIIRFKKIGESVQNTISGKITLIK
ncbi:MAG: gliding motility-associated C-terminal domain-containing protein [Bacteroidota bacterium]|jgi:gliding motility-associated-like protein